MKKALAKARRPVIVAGVGLTAGHRRNAYTAALREFVADSTVPVLTTYKARGVVGDNSAAAAGVVTGGTAESALLRKADLIVGVGLDPVELLPTAWEYEAPVYLVNPWPTREVEYFGRHLAAEAAGDLETALSELRDHLHSGWPDDAARDYRGAGPSKAESGDHLAHRRADATTGSHGRQQTSTARLNRDRRLGRPHARGRASLDGR